MLSAQAASMLLEPILLFPAFIITFTCRGYARALTAKLLGDTTPAQSGFLTLNPTVHIDLGVAVVLVLAFSILELFVPLRTITNHLFLVILFIFGPQWRSPVPISPRNFKNAARALALISLSGSVSNFLCSILIVCLIKTVTILIPGCFFTQTLAQLGAVTLNISVFFGTLFLMPIPPFDGSFILVYLIPASERIVAKLASHSLLMIVFILLFLDGVILLPLLLVKYLLLQLAIS